MNFSEKHIKIIKEEVSKFLNEQNTTRQSAENIKQFINNSQELPQVLQGYRLDKQPSFFVDNNKRIFLYPTYTSENGEIDLTIELQIQPEGDAFKPMLVVRKASFDENGEKEYI